MLLTFIPRPQLIYINIYQFPSIKFILISSPEVGTADTKIMPANAGIYKLKQAWNGFYSSKNRFKEQFYYSVCLSFTERVSLTISELFELLL